MLDAVMKGNYQAASSKEGYRTDEAIYAAWLQMIEFPLMNRLGLTHFKRIIAPPE
jgi:hypothetical protein